MSKVDQLSPVMDFIGKAISVRSLDREESHWSGVILKSVSELGINVSWESRGNQYQDFIPWHIVHCVGWKSAASEKQEVGRSSAE